MFLPFAHRTTSLLTTRSTSICTRSFSSSLWRLKLSVKPGSIPIPKPQTRLPRVDPKVFSQTRSVNDVKAIRTLTALYEAGQTSLYKSPSHKAFIAGCCLIGATAATCFYNILLSKLWNYEHVKELHHKYPFLISSVNIISCIFLIAVTVTVFNKPSNYILAVNIVKGQQSHKLLVTTRRALGLREPNKYIIGPGDLHLDRNVVGYVGSPESITTDVGRQATRAAEIGGVLTKLWAVPYTTVRQIMFREGIVHASVPNSKGGQMNLNLDTNGKDMRDMQHLIELSTIDH